MKPRLKNGLVSAATRRSILKRLLIAGALVLGTVTNADASPLLEHQGSGLGGTTNENQQLAKVTVGSTNVQIGGFGVYGRAQTTTSLGWVIFDMNDLLNPVFVSGPQQVNATTSATWYDISAPLTMLAGHTYAMGVVADKVNSGGFQWSTTYNPFGGSATTQNGLSLLHSTAGVRAGYCNGGWGPCGATTLSAFLEGTYPDVFMSTLDTRTKMSLHVQAVPEPAEWSMLIAGLLVVGFMAHRRKPGLS